MHYRLCDNGCGKVSLACARSTNQHHALGLFHKVAAVQLFDCGLIDQALTEVKAHQVPIHRELGHAQLAVQQPYFANTCERCSWTGRFVGLFPESTHHRENASVELRSISPRLSLFDFPRHIQTGNCVIRGSNFDANLYPKWVNFGCNSTLVDSACGRKSQSVLMCIIPFIGIPNSFLFHIHD